MTEIWVYKADGTIQCVPAEKTEITLAQMRKQLAELIGAGNILAEEKRPPAGPVPAACGRPTGNLNAYKITIRGLQLLFSGIEGPSGFEVDPRTRIMGDSDDPIFPWPTGKVLSEDDRWVPWPWAAMASGNPEDAPHAFINVLASLTQVGATPTLISDLIGRSVRVFNEGKMVPSDYSSQRVNIVLDDGRISRIWFG